MSSNRLLYSSLILGSESLAGVAVLEILTRSLTPRVLKSDLAVLGMLKVVGLLGIFNWQGRGGLAQHAWQWPCSGIRGLHLGG